MPTQINSHDLNEGIDRKQLALVKQRFLSLNRERYQRTQAALSDRQKDFLVLLPLVFHVNHPMLPGYVSHRTPSGVAHYKPGKDELRCAQVLARSFRYHRDLRVREMEIDALFIMGSIGTVAQSDTSDMDIWVCHRDGLSGEALAELQLKCDQISRWAEQNIRLEVHFFLMNPGRFHAGQLGQLSSEGSGSAQHYLLLDEFYRTALWLAGKIPLWWFVPADREGDYQAYTQELLSRRFVPAAEIIDFGGVPETPLSEFIGAGIWHLYKGIEAPYKSVLKLMLLEVYAADKGCRPLALEFKAALYAREPDPDLLDPYVMIYRHLAAYLQSLEQRQRLELVRRSLYFKVNKPLTRPPARGYKSWQRELLETLVTEWAWPNHRLHLLDSRRYWKAPEVLGERSLLVNELNASYRLISSLGKTTRLSVNISEEELMVLGRKLHAAFERKAGKVEWVNPGISEDLHEPALCLVRTQAVETALDDYSDSRSQSFWELHRGTYAEFKSRDKSLLPLKKSRQFLELFLWCYCNGMLSAGTRLDIHNQAGDTQDWSFNEAQKQQLLHNLQQWLPLPLPASSHEVFKSGARPEHLLMLFNLGREPQPGLRKRGLQLLSNRQDALGYSGLRENLVLSADIVQFNSWQEVLCRHYDTDPLVNCLLYYLRLLPPGRGLALPELTIRCLNTQQGPLVVQRLEELWRDLVGCYYSGIRPANTRYLLETGDEYLLVQFFQQQPQISRFASYPDLLEKLASPQAEYSPLVVDRYALLDQPLKLLCEAASQPGIHLYYQVNERAGDQSANITLLDEKASLFTTTMPYHNRRTLLRPLHYFIRSVLTRQNLVADLTREPASHYELHFYELRGNPGQGRGYLEPRSIASDINELAFVSIQVIAEPGEETGISYTIYCDQREFSELELGADLFREVAGYILSQRRGGERYPCYITDLDLTQCRDLIAPQGGLQLSHYLRIKAELEQLLNRALEKI